MNSRSEEIKNNIEKQLLWDDQVNASDIHVEIKEGTVKLTGSVPAFTDYRTAETDTLLIPGVSNVDNQLEVSFPSDLSVPDDAEIQNAISNTLKWNSRLDHTDINTSVSEGFVFLEGSVKTYWEKMIAEDITHSINGVLGVTNKLAVVTSKSIDDEDIAQQLIDAIDRNINIDPETIDVKVEEGVITLTGTVASFKESRNIYELALNTPGVVEVQNKISIGLF